MQIDAPIKCDVVLVGGGHAHVAVLKGFGMKPEPGVRLNLISPATLTPYSGMLPGYLAGHYTLDETHLDLRALARFAGARYYQAAATDIDLAAGTVICAGRPPVAFDLLSIDIGSTPTEDTIEGAETAIPVKPVDRFLERWDAVEREIIASGGAHHLVVIGAGAGGVEAALALNFRVRQALERTGKPAAAFKVSVVAHSKAPLETHGRGTRQRMRRALARAGIDFHGGHTVRAIGPGRLVCEPALDLGFDSVVLVTPGAAAPWLRETGLALDERGFIRVYETLQSVGDARVFAAGDTAAFERQPLPKSGVYAVRQGPVLAASLRALATGGSPRAYNPQHRTLALVSMGAKRAVLSYGALTAEGDWAWRFKDWIDRRWMRKYQELPAMEADDAEPDGFDPMRCGGCGAKVPADVLKRALEAVATDARGATSAPAVLVGLDAPDDAAVLTPPPGKALVQTFDQFRAFIEDPYLFGRIAANHCLGDIHAMGAEPASALAAVTLPFADAAKTGHDLEQLLRGALATFADEGVALIGGHTGEGGEMMLGFSVNGFVDEGAMLRKGGLRPGDAMILTKPLGTGALLAADMRHAADGRWIDAAIETMLRSNGPAAAIARAHGASAATDVTGFGLAGHLVEMAEPAGISVTLRLDDIPVLEGARAVMAAGIASSLQPDNARGAAAQLGGRSGEPAAQILFDPQTAGGLLIGVPGDRAEACLAELRKAGYDRAAVIGQATARDGKEPLIALA
jgi:selenide,water dikinase